MIAITSNQSWHRFQPIIQAIVCWMFFIYLYFILKNNQQLNHYSAYFPLIGEAGLDALAALLAFKLKAQFQEKVYQRLFLILSISFIAALFSDFIYNIFLNLFDFNYKSTIIV